MRQAHTKVEPPPTVPSRTMCGPGATWPNRKNRAVAKPLLHLFVPPPFPPMKCEYTRRKVLLRSPKRDQWHAWKMALRREQRALAAATELPKPAAPVHSLH